MGKHFFLIIGSCFLLVLLFLVGSCKQNEGDRCQIDSDCSEGLICCRAFNISAAVGGTCHPADKCDTAYDGGTQSTPDAKVHSDAKTVETKDSSLKDQTAAKKDLSVVDKGIDQTTGHKDAKIDAVISPDGSTR